MGMDWRYSSVPVKAQALTRYTLEVTAMTPTRASTQTRSGTSILTVMASATIPLRGEREL